MKKENISSLQKYPLGLHQVTGTPSPNSHDFQHHTWVFPSFWTLFKRNHTVYFLCLAVFFFFLLNLNYVRCIYTIVCSGGLFITMLVFISLFECTSIYLPILLLMGITVVSCFRLLRIVLLWLFFYTSFGEFISDGYILRSGIARSYGLCIFRFSRHYCTVSKGL